MRFLRSNTAVRISIGPFIDKTDGLTPKNTLTVANLTAEIVYDADDGDAVTLSNSAHFHPAASGSSNDLVALGDTGMWDLELTATQTNYTGRMMLCITDKDQICPVFHEFQVLTANVYDSLFLGHSSSVSADKLDVNAAELGGTSQTGRDVGASVLLSAGTGTGQISLSSGAVTVGTLPATANIAITGNITGNLSGSVGSVTGNVSGSVASIGTGGIASTSFAAGAINDAAIANAAIDFATFAADCKTGTGLKANVESISANAITAAAIAADAIGASELAADAVTEIQNGLATAAELAKVPKSDSTVTWNATALGSIVTQCGTAITNASLATSSELAKVPKSDSNVTFNSTAVSAIQNGLATPTNITAGTITTVTNLTNAPSSGDFTATMKTSLNAATPSVSVSLTAQDIADIAEGIITNLPTAVNVTSDSENISIS